MCIAPWVSTIDSSKVGGRGQWGHDLDKNYFRVEWWNPKSKRSKDQRRSLEMFEGQMNSWVIFSQFYPLNGCYQHFQVWFYWNNYILSYGIKHVPTSFIRVLEKRGRDNPLHFQKWRGHVPIICWHPCIVWRVGGGYPSGMQLYFHHFHSTSSIHFKQTMLI